tara:strand:- start:19093 stop:20610 length:1518 start_codon:yes stop_codon:yes gene_type:complete
MLRKILINTLSNYVLKGILIILNIIAIPIFINELGAGFYGVIVLAGTLLANFIVFDLGFVAGVTKYVASFKAINDQNSINKVISTTLFLSICFGLFLCIVLFTAVNFGLLELLKGKSEYMAESKNIFILAGVLSIIAWPAKILEGALQGLQKFVVLNFYKGIGRISALVLAVFCAKKGFSTTLIFLVLNIDLFIICLSLLYVLKKELPDLSISYIHISKSTFFMIFSFSAWIMLSQVAVLVEYQLDTLIIGLFLPIAAVATYVVIIYPFRIIQQVSGLAASAIMPAVAEMHALKGDDSIEPFVNFGSKWHNGLLASATLASAICCYPFINIWMNGQFNEYIWIAQLACIFQLLWQANAMVGQVYIGAGYSKKVGLIAVLCGVLNLIFSIILVNLIGLEGVILGTIFAGIIGEIVFFITCFKDLGISRRNYVYECLFKGQLPALSCFVLLLPAYNHIQDIDNWISLILVFSIILISMLLASFIFISSREDRTNIVKLLNQRNEHSK